LILRIAYFLKRWPLIKVAFLYARFFLAIC
jgi:hypothetical protein